jgi:hypothetical protein
VQAVHKTAHALPVTLALKKRHAPTIRMLVGAAAALREAAEAEGDVGRRVAVHSEELAHVGIVFQPPMMRA